MKNIKLFAFCITLLIPSVFASTKPNIVLIISDDQAWNDFSFMGHKKIETPNLDKLAKNSALFRRGYVPTGLCRPSLMTIATGLYASEHRITGNDPSRDLYKGTEKKEFAKKMAMVVRKLDTLPKLLAKKGYLSHQSGKWWEGNYEDGGFTHGMTEGLFKSPKGGRHGDKGLRIGREGIGPIRNFVKEAKAKRKPFFIQYAPFLPHTPHTPPSNLFKKYQQKVDNKFIAKYYAMCEWFDQTCGELVDVIDEAKVRKNTMFVFVTDNGWINRTDRSHFAARSKQSAHEGGVRTPIFFSWPGHIKPADRPEIVSSIDIFPTILSVAGIKPPSNRKGLDLWDHLKTGKQIKRDTIYGENFSHDVISLENIESTLLHRWVIEDEYKLILTYDGDAGHYAKYHDFSDMRPQLYNLIKDPHETTNLAGSKPSLVKKLATKLHQWYPVKKRKALKVFGKHKKLSMTK